MFNTSLIQLTAIVSGGCAISKEVERLQEEVPAIIGNDFSFAGLPKGKKVTKEIELKRNECTITRNVYAEALNVPVVFRQKGSKVKALLEFVKSKEGRAYRDSQGMTKNRYIAAALMFIDTPGFAEAGFKVSEKF